MAENEKTAPTVPTAIGTEQPSQMDCTNSITENSEDCNTESYSYRDFLRKMTDPYYIHVMSLSELYDTVYESKPPIIDGLLYPGVYLFVGAPKVGKSFLMAQIAYHVSTGTELWGYPVNKAISKFVTADNPDWTGTATELLEKTGADIPVNSITKRLNINASRLLNEHSIVYRSSRTHDGRRIELHYVPRNSS